MLFGGLLVAAAGFVLSGRRVERTVYRPDPWALAEWLVAASGITAAVVMVVAGHVDPANLNPSLEPLRWPELALLPVLGILVGVLPAWLAPPVVARSRRVPGGVRVDPDTAAPAPEPARAEPEAVRVP